jgi:hypothetical protein
MAALVNDGDAQRENERDEQNAQVGREAGGRRLGAVSGVDSMRVRVHLYERNFPEEPNNAFSVGATAVDTAFDTGRRTRRWHEERGSAARQDTHLGA